jgi:transposase
MTGAGSARQGASGARKSIAIGIDGVDGARAGIWLDWSWAKMVVVEQPSEGAPSMGKSITNLSSVTTVGLDLAKHVFQVHGIDASGRVIVAKALRRKDVLAFFAQLPQCLVGMEACSSAHYWARELIKLGHDARMMPPAYVKPYVRRQKNDAADAAGICEAVTRPSMRFTGVRTLENQAALMHHKAREMLVAQRTQLINALRGHLAEIGIIAAQGLKNARELAGVIKAEGDMTIPACVRTALAPLVRQLHALDPGDRVQRRCNGTMARDDEMARRLMTIPAWAR